MPSTTHIPLSLSFHPLSLPHYSRLQADIHSNWHPETSLPSHKALTYNHISSPSDPSTLDDDLCDFFADTAFSETDQEPIWVNDPLRLRLTSTQFHILVIDADPLISLAAAPWARPLVVVRSRDIPAYYPAILKSAIRLLPRFDAETGLNMQTVAIYFLSKMFARTDATDMRILERVGALLGLGFADREEDLARTMLYLMRRVWGREAGGTFMVGEMLRFYGGLDEWRSRFLKRLQRIPQAGIEWALREPVTHQGLLDVLNRIRVNVGASIRHTFSIDGRSSPVTDFIASLPTVNVEDLAHDDRACPICRGEYGEVGSMLDGEAEGPVRLPCSHVFGGSCLTVLLRPKPEGWGEKLCPLCRREVPLPQRWIPSGFRP